MIWYILQSFTVYWPSEQNNACEWSDVRGRCCTKSLSHALTSVWLCSQRRALLPIQLRRSRPSKERTGVRTFRGRPEVNYFNPRFLKFKTSWAVSSYSLLQWGERVKTCTLRTSSPLPGRVHCAWTAILTPLKSKWSSPTITRPLHQFMLSGGGFTPGGGVSCAKPGGQSERSCVRSRDTGTAWLLCACGSVSWARLSGRTSTCNLPTCTCRASHLHREATR